jgi:hypothetical protein
MSLVRWLRMWGVGVSCLGMAWCLSFAPPQVLAQAPVTALMSRPVLQRAELKVRVELSVEQGWQVYGPSAAAELGPISMALDGAPDHELLNVAWPEETQIQAPEGALTRGYPSNFSVEAVVRMKPAQAGEGVPSGGGDSVPAAMGAAPTLAQEEEEAGEDSSLKEVPPLRASITMAWLACNTERLRKSSSASSLKAACIPGEALFVLKTLPLAQPTATPRPTLAAPVAKVMGASKSSSSPPSKKATN